jgi:hypothetical protein
MKINRLLVLGFFGLIVLCLQVACRSKQVATNGVLTTKTTTVLTRDTVIKTEADSSFYWAWIDCVNGKPVLRRDTVYSTSKLNKETEKAGKYLKVPDVSLNGNNLTVNCEAKAQELFKTWQQQYVSEHQTETITLPPVEVEKKLSWWQSTQIYLGRIFLAFLVIRLAWWFFKSKIKTLLNIK